MDSNDARIIDSIASGLIAVDARGRILAANAAARAFLRVDSEALRPGTLLEAAPAAAALVPMWDEVRQTRKAASRREIQVEANDGAVMEIGLSVSLLAGPADFNGAVFLFTDMTERRKAERAAEINRQLAALGELTAGVVHELRNPVTVISGMAELLMRRLEAQDERRKTAEAIHREAAHLEKSIAQFLGFARPFRLERTRCRPEAIVQRAMELCRRRARQKEVAVTATCEENLPEMHVDASRMAQALANLLDNGAEAVASGGAVSLRAYQEGRMIVFEVTDNGPGIQLPPGASLFTPFYTTKESGTGLGLSIVHRTVTAHNGSVTYENRPEGGARFEVRVPIEA